MSTERTIETMLADWLDATANEQDAAVIHDQGMRAVRRSRPRPTWLAVVHGGALGGGARTHRPAVRWATLLLIVAALVAALVAGAIVGARLLQAPRPLPRPFGPAINGKIAFSKDGDIWVTDGDTRLASKLVADPAEDSYPLFAPDGSRFIFQRDAPGQPSRVMVANADGTGVRPIADVPGEWTWTDWSPDSQSILVGLGGRWADGDTHPGRGRGRTAAHTGPCRRRAQRLCPVAPTGRQGDPVHGISPGAPSRRAIPALARRWATADHRIAEAGRLARWPVPVPGRVARWPDHRVRQLGGE